MIFAAYAFACAFFWMCGYNRVHEPAIALAAGTLASIAAWHLESSYYGAMAAIDFMIIGYLWLMVKPWNLACKIIAGLSLFSILVNAIGFGLYMAYESPLIYNALSWSIITLQLATLWMLRHGRLRAKPTLGAVLRFFSGHRVQYDHVESPKEERGR